MRLNDYIKTNSLFQELYTKESLTGFILIVPEYDLMDELLAYTYGDRLLSPKFIDSSNSPSISLIALHLDKAYNAKWSALLNIEKNKEIHDNVNTTVETIDNSSVKTNNAESLNKVSAYNTEELLTDDGNTVTSNEGVDGNTIRTNTNTDTNFRNQYLNISQLHKNNIIDTILYDVANALTLSIY